MIRMSESIKENPSIVRIQVDRLFFEVLLERSSDKYLPIGSLIQEVTSRYPTSQVRKVRNHCVFLVSCCVAGADPILQTNYEAYYADGSSTFLSKDDHEEYLSSGFHEGYGDVVEVLPFYRCRPDAAPFLSAIVSALAPSNPNVCNVSKRLVEQACS
jgi:hypothetical protein